jgi:hypothetical protein
MYRELIAGAFMARQGFAVRYAPNINGQTPDWYFKSDGVGEFLPEVMNFQSPEKIREEQVRALDENGPRLWSGSTPENTVRLWSAMLSKTTKYKKLTNETGLPFVLIVHGLFTACLDSVEVGKCILPSDGLFAEYPDLSGVYHMYESTYKGRLQLSWDGKQLNVLADTGDLRDPETGYRFEYYANPKAARPAPRLPNGLLPYRFPARQA